MSSQAKRTSKKDEKRRRTPTRGIAIDLDRPRRLRFPIGALRDLDVTQISLGNILLMGLKDDDPTLTIEEIEDIIELQHLPQLKPALKKATGGLVDLETFFTSAQEAAEKATDPPPPATES